jgi:hypothetical protein
MVLFLLSTQSFSVFLQQPGREYLSRQMDFLFSQKRLNVALSRARSLAILIANPRLLETACNTVEQIGLINTLCRGYYAGISDCCSTGADLPVSRTEAGDINGMKQYSKKERQKLRMAGRNLFL